MERVEGNALELRRDAELRHAAPAVPVDGLDSRQREGARQHLIRRKIGNVHGRPDPSFDLLPDRCAVRDRPHLSRAVVSRSVSKRAAPERREVPVRSARPRERRDGVTDGFARASAPARGGAGGRETPASDSLNRLSRLPSSWSYDREHVHENSEFRRITTCAIMRVWRLLGTGISRGREQ